MSARYQSAGLSGRNLLRRGERFLYDLRQLYSLALAVMPLGECFSLAMQCYAIKSESIIIVIFNSNQSKVE